MEHVVRVKEEIVEASTSGRRQQAPKKVCASKQPPAAVIQLSTSSSSSSSESDSDSDSDHNVAVSMRARDSEAKRRKLEAAVDVVLPVGFLASLPPPPTPPVAAATAAAATAQAPKRSENVNVGWSGQSCKQFWKAGDYVGASCSTNRDIPSGGMDHVRVHPKFLHSNATSHKWALGAFAELLDNALDEHGNGATYVNVDMIESKKDKSKMLLVEDNGGGMDPDKMRQCMSLGYSAKSKVANTIGQYGNGFKTSTMRLGADVIVFSRCPGQKGKSPTQSIGLLSYTFLRSTGKEDIVVPMLDYERKGKEWKRMVRCPTGDWNINIEAMVQWSPFSSETDLLRQFNHMPDHGTCIIIYNLWEDDQGLLELDFDSDPHDIQLRGVNRDEKNIDMAKQFPNSKHFLTYRHSLRSYASILYLRLPPRFRIILRRKDVEHHNIVNDMMLSENITYRPQSAADTVLKDANMTAVVTIGFVKDAKHHIDVQGFNVYHKNRLIKPFWRLWNAAGSDGRGVIGLLEANFVEPAHDKQGFERTTVLARLEARLVQMQKTYWSANCHKIGYAPRRNKKGLNDTVDREASPDYHMNSSSSGAKFTSLSSKRSPSKSSWHGNGQKKTRKGTYPEPSSTSEDESDDDVCIVKRGNGISQKKPATKKYPTKDGLPATQLPSHSEDSESQQDCMSEGANAGPVTKSQSKVGALALQLSDSQTVDDLRREKHELKKRLERWEGETPGVVMHRSRCETCVSLETQLQEAQHKVEQLTNEQESLIQIFAEDRDQRDKEEENLRKKLKDASNTIQELLDKVRLLEKMKASKLKADR